MSDWIPGTLELTSKVRYGLTSKGTPIFRFIPYERSLLPFAVGCSQRNLFHNVHAIVTPCEPTNQGKGSLQKAILIQNLGKPSEESELQVLLANYAYDCKKKLRASASASASAEAAAEAEAAAALTPADTDAHSPRQEIKGYTFNIDPPGCRDVDDSFTFLKTGTTWQVSINIADVSAWVQEGSPEDLMAMERATSFYSEGECLVPMFPRHISEGVASLGGDGPKPALSLQFTYDPDSPEKRLSDFKWIQSTVTKTRSYTYDQANACANAKEELLALKALTNSEDSHEWVERMMILYNEKAGEALKAKGILRSHSAPQAQALEGLVEIDPALAFLAYESATFVLPTEDTRHFGLNSAAYAYASSPIRRYCDVVNQRALKGILKTPITQDLVDSLNRRQKQAKAFSRDLFFMTQLSSQRNNCESVEGTIIDSKKVYVPVWKRCVKVRNLDLSKGTKVRLQWFEDREKPNWKERIVFKVDA